MQTWKIDKEIALFGVEAESFPSGVASCWQQLHQRLGNTQGRNFFGVSHGSEDGKIVYKACVEEVFDGEAKQFGLQTFSLPSGEYMGETIHDFMQNTTKIGDVFQALLQRSDYDKNGACIEHYLDDKNVECMIGKAES